MNWFGISQDLRMGRASNTMLPTQNFGTTNPAMESSPGRFISLPDQIEDLPKI